MSTVNTVLFGDNLYDITQAYAKGVRAARDGSIRFDSNAYAEDTQEYDEWSYGFDNTSQWGHRLEDGTDILDIPASGREFIAPEEVF